MIPKAPELQPFIKNVEIIAKKYNVDIEYCAMAWVLQQENLDSIIFGVENIEQLDKNYLYFKNSTRNIKLADDLREMSLPSKVSVDPRNWLKV
jgi:aryl-alcohol dehydrogenase-like predicted oxidoreductase